jgi:putative addiction module component (TIGR02574 family)
MKLTVRERAKLAQQLVSSLEDVAETGVEESWAAEAERRLEELRAGKVKGLKAAEAFKKARKSLHR